MKKIVLFLFFLFLYTTASGYNFPTDTINVRGDITGNVSSGSIIDIPDGETFTILHESVNTSTSQTNANIKLFCGNEILLFLQNFTWNPIIERPKFAKCTDYIYITTSWMQAGAITTYSILYVPYDLLYDPWQVQTILTGMDTEILTEENMLDIWIAEVIVFLFIIMYRYFTFLIIWKWKR